MLIVLTRKPTDGRWEFFQPTSASAFPISHPAYGKYTGLSVIREGVQFRLKVCFSLAFFFFFGCVRTPGNVAVGVAFAWPLTPAPAYFDPECVITAWAIEIQRNLCVCLSQICCGALNLHMKGCCGLQIRKQTEFAGILPLAKCINPPNSDRFLTHCVDFQVHPIKTVNNYHKIISVIILLFVVLY